MEIQNEKKSPTIHFSDFSKLDLRIAKIINASAIVGSDKLVKLIVDIGHEERNIVAGIRKSYPPENLVGREIVIVANLAPRKLLGEESNGMLLAVDAGDETVLLKPELSVPPGSRVS